MSADTIAPGMGSQPLNRYMYVGGNPLRYTDPLGYYQCQGEGCEVAVELFLAGLGLAGEEGQHLREYFLSLGDDVIVIVSSDTDLMATDRPGIGTPTIYLNPGVVQHINGECDWYDWLYLSSAFGHEIRHVEQGPWSFPSQRAEQEAYDLQYQLMENMGILDEAIERNEMGELVPAVVYHNDPGLLHYSYRFIEPPFFSAYGIMQKLWVAAAWLQVLSDTRLFNLPEETVVPLPQELLDRFFGRQWYEW